MARMSKEAIAERVVTWCAKSENYEAGWDFVIECYGESGIVELMTEENMTQKKQVWDHLRLVKDVYNDRVADARDSAF